MIASVACVKQKVPANATITRVSYACHVPETVLRHIETSIKPLYASANLRDINKQQKNIAGYNYFPGAEKRKNDVFTKTCVKENSLIRIISLPLSPSCLQNHKNDANDNFFTLKIADFLGKNVNYYETKLFTAHS